jgi:hypothetical protein
MEADTVRVTLHSRLTEIGTLDLWCTEISGNRSWKLQFDVRSATRTDLPVHKGIGEQMGFVDSTVLSECRDIILDTFRPKQGKTADPSQLMKKLEQKIGMDRNSWPPSLLRSFWEILLEVEFGRSIDPQHELRWLNFMGFSLRPGYGYAVDDWRVKQTWHIFPERDHSSQKPSLQIRVVDFLETNRRWIDPGAAAYTGSESYDRPAVSVYRF